MVLSTHGISSLRYNFEAQNCYRFHYLNASGVNSSFLSVLNPVS